MQPSPYAIRNLVRDSGSYATYFEGRIATDIFHVCRHYSSLSYSLENHAGSDGISRSLIYISGTIPITYHGATYNIPIGLWVTAWYPMGPPLPYVVPTANMVIKPNHANVNSSNGVVENISEISSWNTSSSSLLNVIRDMIVMFSKAPPVYAKRQGQPSVVPNDLEKKRLIAEVTAVAVQRLTQVAVDARMEHAELEHELGELDVIQESLNTELCGVASSQKHISEQIAKAQNELQIVLNKIVANNVDGGDVTWEGSLEALNPYTEQVVDFTARDFANADAIKCASDALGRNAIGVDMFMKETKRLSSEQFTCRALRMKARHLQQQAAS